MRRHRLSFTERRRVRMALKFDRLEQLDNKTLVTEPINVFALSMGLPLGLIGTLNPGRVPTARTTEQAERGSRAADARESQATTERLAIVLPSRPAGSSVGATGPDVASGGSTNASAAGDWLALSPLSSSGTGSSMPMPHMPSSANRGGGAVSAGHPTAASIPARGAIAPFRVPANPQASLSTAASGALLSALSLGGTGPSPAAHPEGAPTPRAATAAPAAATAATVATAQPGVAGASQQTSPAFTVYTLDYNDGNVFVPGFNELATPGGSVDLRAQVEDSATGTYTYSWNTAGLTDATNIAGAGTYDLTFQWNTTIATAKDESVTLTVTDPNLNQVSQTYTFQVPAGTGTATGGTTWNNQELPPNLVQADAPGIASQNVSVVAATGSLETSINLPSYNPNVAPLELNYDSLAANPMPIVVAEHVLDPTKSAPSQVEAQLTFNGTPQTAYYYNTSSLQPGDIQQIALQANASALSTGRYAYTVNIYDLRNGVPTTFTYNDTATVINESKDPTFSALGAGWTVSGLNKIIPAGGGVILDEGDGSSLWFTGSFGSGGGTFTSPAGDFSTLVENSGRLIHADPDRRDAAELQLRRLPDGYHRPQRPDDRLYL